MYAVDLFCGAGGSSTGLELAGVEVVSAANHWQLAIETHQTNHPNTDHECADIRLVHPSRFPHTEILWASPECTNHSLAKGRRRKSISQRTLWGDDNFDPEEERSRATMREVIDFADYHHNPIIIVENVVDIRHWAYYDDWLQAMHNLGYLHRTLYLNAQFFGVPQSRDRWYTVFWLRGNRAPDLDFRPPAWCPKCEREVSAVQSWKNPDKQWGRYGDRRQYVYRCPHCAAIVEPLTTPAYVAIDWSLHGERIGSRGRPLKPKTMQRIKAGVRKFGRKVVVDTAFGDGDRATPVDTPLPVQTTRQTLSLIDPFIAVMRTGTGPQVADTEQPLAAITAGGGHHALIEPHVVTLRQSVQHRSLDESLSTISAGGNNHGLVAPPFIAVLKNSWSRDGKYVLPPLSLDDPLSTIVASASQHALIMSYYGGNPVYALPAEALPTVRTVQHLALIDEIGEELTDAEIDQLVEDCTFRMLEPHELQRGMSFPDEYVILGNKRQQVKQIGNAVCVNVAAWIARRCMESLE